MKRLVLVTFVLLLAQTPAQIQDALSHLNAALADLQPPTSTTTGKVTTVAAGANLQAAINAAGCGDTLKLTAGATYTGNFVLPVKACTSTTPITLGSTWTVPAAGVRVSPSAPFPKIVAAAGGAAALATAPGAHDWNIEGLEFQPGSGTFDLVTLGDGSSAQTTLAQVPFNLSFRHNYIHAVDPATVKRGIALNSRSTTIADNYISNIKTAGQDSQAIGGWNGPGDYTITNNYLEAATQSVQFGGSDPSIVGLVPSNIVVSGNTMTKQVAWLSQLGKWDIKNSIELKSAAHVVIKNNVMEYVWGDAQGGFAVVLTVRNQADGKGCPQCTLQDIQVLGNVIRHVGGVLNVLALDDGHGGATPFPSVRAAGLVFSGNLAYDVDTVKWGGLGRIFQIIDGPNGLTIDHNTIAQAPSAGWQNALFAFQYGTYPVAGLVYTNNVAPEGEYGIIASGEAIGAPTLAAHAPGYVWTNDTVILGGGIVGGGNGSYSYPAGTVTSKAVLNADYTLAPGFTGGADIASLKTNIPNLDLSK